MSALLVALAVAVVVVGVVGTVLPGLPGAAFVLVGLVWLLWLDGFTHAGAGTVIVLVLLTVGCYVVEFGATALGAKRSGASGWAIAGAAAGTVLGLFLGLPGLLVGPFVGAVAGEYFSRGNLEEATRAGVGAWIGLVVGTAGKLALVVSMVAIVAVAFLLG